MDWSVFAPNSSSNVRPARDARPSVTELLPELLVGEYPRLEDIHWLKTAHAVTAIHNLQDDDDLRIFGIDAAALRETCRMSSIKIVRTPISDGSADELSLHLERALADLKALTDAGERVYLHCNAGLNRAPTVAIAFMRAYRDMSLDEALAHVKQRRVCGPFMTVLENYFGPRHLKAGK